jgi:hypothetical protein
MPCCGLHEHRTSLPARYIVVGALFFWGIFTAGLLVGLLTIWSKRGRYALRVQAGFIRSLWAETMRERDSIPARWSCRLSGRALRVSPRLAEVIYRYPEVPFIYAPLLALGLLVSSGVYLVRAL